MKITVNFKLKIHTVYTSHTPSSVYLLWG